LGGNGRSPISCGVGRRALMEGGDHLANEGADPDGRYPGRDASPGDGASLVEELSDSTPVPWLKTQRQCRAALLLHLRRTEPSLGCAAFCTALDALLDREGTQSPGRHNAIVDRCR
jgi:hypothetical protein